MPPDLELAQAHETRITLLEQQQIDIRNTLKELAADTRKMVAALTQQAEDREALKRAFGQIDRVSERLDAIDKRIDAIERARLEAENAALQRQINADNDSKRAVIMEVVRNIIVIAAALFAYHLGVKML